MLFIISIHHGIHKKSHEVNGFLEYRGGLNISLDWVMLLQSYCKLLIYKKCTILLLLCASILSPLMENLPLCTEQSAYVQSRRRQQLPS